MVIFLNFKPSVMLVVDFSWLMSLGDFDFEVEDNTIPVPLPEYHPAI